MNHPIFSRFLWSAVAIALLVPGASLYRHYRADLAAAYRRISEGSQVVETACGPIQYTEFGSGDPVLMVHGSGGGYDQGAYMAKMIGENYRWIAPSRFGYLDTPAGPEADTVRQADAHACLLDALGVERASVVGVSGGGPSALVFAQRYPQRTSSLVLISAVSHAMPERPEIQAALFNIFTNDVVFWSLLHASPDGMLSLLGLPAEDQQALSPETLAQANHFLETILPMNPRKNGQVLEQRMSEYDAQQIRQIKAPTLVMHARNDTLVPFEQGEYSAQNVPGAQLIAPDHGGHLALLVYPELRAKVTQFLDQNHE